MLTDAIRLLLFPALMAFAASSDLLTMTISNRLSLALAGGFFLLTLVTGMSLYAFGMHLAAAAVVLTAAFVFFSQG
jgi:prepilin peptidase CpaA